MDPRPTSPIALDPADWFWAPWRGCTPLARPEPAPVDLAGCVARLGRARSGRQKRCDWSKFGLAPALSAEEAQFWFEAMLCSPGVPLAELTRHLAAMPLDFGSHPIDLGGLRDGIANLRPEIVLPLSHFLSPEAVVEVLLL